MDGSDGPRSAIAIAGTRTSLIIRSWLAVARMPIASQVSTNSRPGVPLRHDGRWPSEGGFESSIVAITMKKSITGDRLVNILRPLRMYASPSRRALVAKKAPIAAPFGLADSAADDLLCRVR